jgi:hypothetical protein
MKSLAARAGISAGWILGGLFLITLELAAQDFNQAPAPSSLPPIQSLGPPPLLGPDQSLMPAAALGPEQSFASQPAFAPNQQSLGGQGGRVGQSNGSPFRTGLWELDPGVSYQYNATSGIQSSPGQPSTTTVQSLTASFLLQYGSMWSLGYSPSWEFYSNPTFQNSVDQQASLSGHFSEGAWAYGVSQTYARTSQQLIETGRQTPEQTYTTGFNALFGAGNAFTLSLVADQSILTSNAVPDADTWSTTEQLRFNLAPHLSLAVANSAGYTLSDPGNNIYYVEPNVQANWEPTSFLTFNVSTGWQRQFIPATDGAVSTQDFDASVSYQPVATSTLTLAARRASSPAQTEDQISSPTVFSLNLGQRLLQHFFLSAGITHESTSYTSTDLGLANTRDDTINSYTVSLATSLFRRANINVQFERSRDASNVPGFSFSSTQVGFGVGYRY